MDIFKPENIRLDMNAGNKGEIFTAIADMAVALGYAHDARAVIQGFETREAQGSTGMQDGFAIPHVLGDAITATGVIILTLKEPVADWETFDDLPVDFVIALIAPGNAAGDDHLKLLSSIARILVHDENRELLRAACTPAEIHDVIASRI